MSANPISNPKIAIAASLLMGGVLTIAALELRPDGSELSSYQPNVENRTASVSASPNSLPSSPGALASGAVSTGGEGYAAVSQVLDAVRFSLDRNDLESAKVLLQAELVLHKDDPRVLALQREVQTREANMGRAPTVARADDTPAEPLPPPHAMHPLVRAGHSRYAESSAREHAARSSRYARTKYPAQVEVTTRPAQRLEAPGSPPASVEARTLPVTPVPAASVSAMAAVAPPIQSQPVYQTPPAAQATPVAQPQPAQPAQSTTALAQSSQGPKTRAQVRMELERARTDGDLPRFGNPDPAGPGGAMSMTVNPSAVSR